MVTARKTTTRATLRRFGSCAHSSGDGTDFDRLSVVLSFLASLSSLIGKTADGRGADLVSRSVCRFSPRVASRILNSLKSAVTLPLEDGSSVPATAITIRVKSSSWVIYPFSLTRIARVSTQKSTANLESSLSFLRKPEKLFGDPKVTQ